MRSFTVPACVLVLMSGCTSSPTGRQQLLLFDKPTMSKLGIAAFSQQLKDTPIETNPVTNAYVACVARAVTAAVPSSWSNNVWDVVVFDSKEVNAFALPGGKIGIHTGILTVTENQDQLAAVIGHEVSHVVASHSNESLSTAYAADAAALTAATVVGSSTGSSQLLYAMLGLGAEVGVVLPFSRIQEAEADALGVVFMAKAGFDPNQAVVLWQNMPNAGGSAHLSFLSTHPSNSARIDQLQEHVDIVLQLLDEADAVLPHPNCGPPP